MQVARSLGGTVPLSPQLIFTPTATVATVQPELGTGSPARPPTPAQVRIPCLWEGRGVGTPERGTDTGYGPKPGGALNLWKGWDLLGKQEGDGTSQGSQTCSFIPHWEGLSHS